MAHKAVLLFDVLERTIDNRGRTPPISRVGYPLVEIKHIQSDRLYPVFADTKFVDQTTWDTWFRGHLNPGDILFSTVGSIARSCIVPDEPKFCIAQNVLAFRVNRSKADPRYIYYAINGGFFLHEVHGRTIETVQKSIKVYDLKTARIPLPPLIEQHAIARILGTLDDKIELNRRMNETLEAMAQALFKSWFVDATQAALPEGWEINHLADITELITKGTTPTQDDVTAAPISDPQVNYLRVNAIAEGGSILYDKLMKIPESVHSKVLKRSVLRSGDVLYTIAGTIGRMTIVEEELLPANCNQAVAIIRPRPGVPSGFLLLSMKQPTFQDELHSNIVHAVQANLSLGMLSRAKIISPPLQTLSSLFRPIDDILRKIWANRSEVRTLAALRDALLPKLLSGELRMRNV